MFWRWTISVWKKILPRGGLKDRIHSKHCYHIFQESNYQASPGFFFTLIDPAGRRQLYPLLEHDRYSFPCSHLYTSPAGSLWLRLLRACSSTAAARKFSPIATMNSPRSWCVLRPRGTSLNDQGWFLVYMCHRFSLFLSNKSKWTKKSISCLKSIWNCFRLCVDMSFIPYYKRIWYGDAGRVLKLLDFKNEEFFFPGKGSAR